MTDTKVRYEIIEMRKQINELNDKCKELAELVLTLFNKLYEISEKKED